MVSIVRLIDVVALAADVPARALVCAETDSIGTSICENSSDKSANSPAWSYAIICISAENVPLASPAHATSTRRSGSLATISRTFMQSARCTDTPRPRVI